MEEFRRFDQIMTQTVLPETQAGGEHCGRACDPGSWLALLLAISDRNAVIYARIPDSLALEAHAYERGLSLTRALVELVERPEAQPSLTRAPSVTMRELRQASPS